jgi:sialic acid synthase SpsE
MNTFVIAEAGANHNKNFNQALALIDVAVESGASACKFQTYSSNTLYSKNTPNFAGYTNINKLIDDIALPREWQKDLKQYCDERGIEFMSTPFDEQAVDELVNLGVKRLKIAGFESTDFRFVEMVASSRLPLVISLGIGFEMNYLGKIFEIANKYGNDLTLMHCNNAYPTPMQDAGLKSVQSLAFDHRYKTGFSDHTMSTLTPALAVAMGATVIEKHFTLSQHLPGPDHPFALEPNQLKEMVDLIKQAELTITPQLSTF